MGYINLDRKFFEDWKKRRKKKWLFIFLRGAIFKGLSVALITIGLTYFLWIEQLGLVFITINIFFWMFLAFVIELWQYNHIDNLYKEFIDNH